MTPPHAGKSVHEADPMADHEFQQSLPVRADDIFLKQTDFHGPPTVMDHGQCCQGVTAVKIEEEPVPVHQHRKIAVYLVLDDEPAFVIQRFRLRKNHHQIMPLHQLHRFADVSPIDQVVVPVQMEGIVARGIIAEGPLKIADHAQVAFVPKIFEPRISTIFLDNILYMVSRMVVADDYLQVRIILIQNGLHRLRHIIGLVIRRDRHADFFHLSTPIVIIPREPPSTLNLPKIGTVAVYDPRKLKSNVVIPALTARRSSPKLDIRLRAFRR